ncbi:hypothetical protein GALMADRAFT_143393 [Galerina marginata CBS 339.88]|uniref:Uncharacterized protein n=1 Tax=Galerina marginata (strain CBS 339.88) TaxID=685588 RepID=A0A067SMD1_GALM3|nr:hypothetical protein GALMADRAFT_143393 [Galerina marginata CBS 339.88]
MLPHGRCGISGRLEGLEGQLQLIQNMDARFTFLSTMKISANIIFIAAAALFSAQANAAPVVEPLGSRWLGYIPSEQVDHLKEISARID